MKHFAFLILKPSNSVAFYFVCDFLLLILQSTGIPLRQDRRQKPFE